MKSTALKTTPGPLLETINGRQVANSAFNNRLLKAHLEHHLTARDHWCTPSCAAKVFESRDCAAARATMRRRIGPAFHALLGLDILLVVEYTETRPFAIKAFKIYQALDEREKNISLRHLGRMLHQKQITLGRYEQAMRMREAITTAKPKE